MTLQSPNHSFFDIVGGAAGGTYELHHQVGAGALGIVYAARQAPLGREVAIKLVRENYAQNPRFTNALLREARAGSRIDHPNVARTYDYGDDQNGRCFLVMELLRGDSLEKILQCVSRPPVAWSVSIVAQVLAGLAAAHERGVIHRDVKPGNVVVETTLDDDGEPIDVAKLCDFGIADIADHDSEHGADEQGFDTNGCGTPGYMSPEQAQGLVCGPQTDIYSCGVLLFELTTGRLPFDGPSPRAIAAKHVLEEPPSPHSLNPTIEPALERIILRAMSKRPEDRHPSVRAMRSELLALSCAQSSPSLMDDWADAPQMLEDFAPDAAVVSSVPTLTPYQWPQAAKGPSALVA
jgi:eukaryotic-like serine/threonine-protein kinase